MASLLAVDLGLRTGLALYVPDRRLAWYRSQHYANRGSLRRGVHGLLDGLPGVSRLVLEGGGPIADIWARDALWRGISVRRVAAEDWRDRLLAPGDRLGRDRSKLAADVLARRVIEWSRAPKPTSLRHDAAEAILVGLWGVMEAGWLEKLPPELLGLVRRLRRMCAEPAPRNQGRCQPITRSHPCGQQRRTFLGRPTGPACQHC